MCKEFKLLGTVSSSPEPVQGQSRTSNEYFWDEEEALAVEGRKMSIKCECEGVNIQALMDTGATKTLMSKKVFDRISKSLEFLGIIKFRTADGNLMDTIKIRGVKIKLGGKEIVWDIHVGKIHQDMIIGIDLLENLSTIINFGDKSVTIGEQTIELENETTKMEEKTNNLQKAKDYKKNSSI